MRFRGKSVVKDKGKQRRKGVSGVSGDQELSSELRDEEGDDEELAKIAKITKIAKEGDNKELEDAELSSELWDKEGDDEELEDAELS